MPPGLLAYCRGEAATPYDDPTGWDEIRKNQPPPDDLWRWVPIDKPADADLREHFAGDSIDLIYLDPPFNSNVNYNAFFQEQTGEPSSAQITAFEDTWHWGLESEAAYRAIVTDGPQKLADLLQAMHAFLGQSDMIAYLSMMAPRIAELHRVLKPTGSIYLHCDPTASHYLSC